MPVKVKKDESTSQKIEVSAGGLEAPSTDKGRLALKALLHGSKRKDRVPKNARKHTKGPVTSDRGGERAPFLSAYPSGRELKPRSKNKKSKGPIQTASLTESINPATAKPYPGPNSLLGLRALAWNSTVVYAIITYRRHQLTKKPVILIPKDKEPTQKLSLLDYNTNEILHLPYLDDYEKKAIVKIYRKIDPMNVYTRKEKVFRASKDILTQNEIALIEALNKRHWDFYQKRRNDTKAIIRFLEDPDPYYSEESTWQYMLSMVLEDLLIIDRGALVKIRDSKGRLVALTPVDGATIRPIIDDNGYIRQYAQVVDGQELVNIYDKDDIILFRMNVTPDIYRYGYGMPNLEVLAKTVLSDIFIDKGNLDYYRKGGSVPEGLLVVEPPGNTDEGYVQLDKETLDGIQRQLQAIIMSDFTQVPLVSGGKFTWIDLKGRRKDMQYKELAEYLTRKICAVFQVSPQDVGVISDVNRSTAETQMSLTRAKGLETLASAISQSLTRGVIDELRPEKDLKLWWQEDDPKIEQEKWITHQQQLNAGVRTVNEIRAEKGDDPVPWGDKPFQGLKNWISPEEEAEMQKGQQGIGGLGGMPGSPTSAPLPLGGQQGGAAPSLIPGQQPGQSLGTPPNLAKSISELVEEVNSEQGEQDDLDVTPLIEAYFPPESDEGYEEIDLLEVADSAFDSKIKGIKLVREVGEIGSSDNKVYVLVNSWLDRAEVHKLISMMFELREDSHIKIVSLDSKKASVSTDNLGIYLPEASGSPLFQLFQKVSLVFFVLSGQYVLRSLDMVLLSDEEEFSHVNGIEIDPLKAEKVFKELAKNFKEERINPEAYPHVFADNDVLDKIAPLLQYDESFRPLGSGVLYNHLFYKMAEMYGKIFKEKDTLSKVAEKLTHKGKYFIKLHELAEKMKLPKMSHRFLPGKVYAILNNVKSTLTDEEKKAAVDVAAWHLFELLEHREMPREEDIELLPELLRVEIPWKINKKEATEAVERAHNNYNELKSYVLSFIERLRESGITVDISESIGAFGKILELNSILPPNSAVTIDMLYGFNDRYSYGVFDSFSPNFYSDMFRDLRILFADVSLALQRHQVALAELEAVLGDGLGINVDGKLNLIDAENKPIETLVDMLNAISVNVDTGEEVVINVLRDMIFGEEVDELNKSMAVALLGE